MTLMDYFCVCVFTVVLGSGGESGFCFPLLVKRLFDGGNVLMSTLRMIAFLRLRCLE